MYLGWGEEAHARIEACGRAMQYNQQAIAKGLSKLKSDEERVTVNESRPNRPLIRSGRFGRNFMVRSREGARSA